MHSGALGFRFRARLAVGSFALVVGACRAPTEIELVLTTDLCTAQDPGDLTLAVTGIVASAPQTLDQQTETVAETPGCKDAAAGYIGNIVSVPSGASDAAVAFEVVSTVNPLRPARECLLSPLPADCAVARRSLRYVEHESLRLPIVIRRNCLGKDCPPDETCVNGQCRKAAVDPEDCASTDGCSEEQLPPAPPSISTAGHSAFCCDPPPAPPPPPWVLHMFGAGSSSARSVAIGPDGDVYVAGEFDGPLTIGSRTHTPPPIGQLGAFVARVDQDGAVQWSAHVASGVALHHRGLAVDSQGTVYLTGSFVGAGSITGSGDVHLNANQFAYVVFLNAADGSYAGHQMHRTAPYLASQPYLEFPAIAVRYPMLYLAGSYRGELSMAAPLDPGGPLQITATRKNIVVAAYDLSHTTTGWLQTSSALFDEGARGLVVADDGQLHLVGTHSSGSVFGISLSGTTALDPQGFHMLLEPNEGIALHAFSIEGPGDQELVGLALAEPKISCTGGTLLTSLQMGTATTLDSNSLADSFIGCADGENHALWAQALAADGSMWLRGVDGNRAGYLYVTGRFDGSMRLGAVDLTYPSKALFAGVLDNVTSQGAHVWSRAVGYEQLAESWAIAGLGSDTVFLAGEFTGQLIVDGEPFGPAYGLDSFLMRLDRAQNR